MTIVFIVLIWVAYSCLTGIKDGYLYHYANTSTAQSKKDLHPLFTAERAVVGSGLTYNYFIYEHPTTMIGIASGILLFGISLMLIFSFFHNGCYLTTRNRLQPDLYPKKFFDDSNTSMSKMEFSYKVRTTLFIAGIILIFFIT
jgi:hypothetical protein